MTCTNAYDTLTAAAGSVINYVAYPDSEHVVTSYCRDANGTWVAWMNTHLGEETGATSQTQRLLDKQTWQSDIASTAAIGVAYFPDDGSPPIAYELGLEAACFEWSSGLYAGRDPCGVYPLLGDKYSDNTASIMTAWFMGTLDVQVRTDGSNVWVVVLAQESVKYPFLHGGSYFDRCNRSHPTLEQDYAAEGGDPFTHDTDTGHRWWEYFEGFPVGGDMPFGPYDDAGPGNSFRWQPARITVFAGDIGGFTLIDHVDAKFKNYASSGFGLIGGIECAASPAEPGVLHVMWSESGDFGVQTVEPQRGQRINYSKWDSSSKLVDTDLLYASEDGSGLVSDSNFVWTAEYILRNDHGSPIAIVWPWLCDGGPQQLGLPEFWDISAGTADILQVMNADLIPTLEESLLTGQVEANGNATTASDSEAGVFSPRIQYASSLYTDPTLANRQVYLICASYAEAGNRGRSGNSVAEAFYRIPCDGSDTFDYMDGTREQMYSIIPAQVLVDAVGVSLFGSDFVSDPDDVWMASHENAGGAVLQLDRQCLRGWNLLTAFPVFDPLIGYETGDFASATSILKASGQSHLELVTDDGGDWLYGGGYGPVLPSDSTKPANIAALKAKICRCCQPCNRTGMHVWETV